MSTILIIGAKSDVAIELAKIYAFHGYDLFLAARNSHEMTDIAKDLKIRSQRNIYLYDFDITKYETHVDFFSSLPEQPNGVILCAGYLGDQTLSQSNFKELGKIIETNYSGPANFLNIVANAFEITQKGFIIAISSVAGDRGRKSNYLYGSSKAGLTAYLSGLRNRLAKHNIQVLTVKPGFIASKMTQHLILPKILTSQPKDVASAIFDAQLKKKNIIYVKPIWKIIMSIITLIPEAFFKRLSI